MDLDEHFLRVTRTMPALCSAINSQEECAFYFCWRTKIPNTKLIILTSLLPCNTCIFADRVVHGGVGSGEKVCILCVCERVEIYGDRECKKASVFCRKKWSSCVYMHSEWNGADVTYECVCVCVCARAPWEMGLITNTDEAAAPMRLAKHPWILLASALLSESEDPCVKILKFEWKSLITANNTPSVHPGYYHQQKLWQ